MKRIAVVIVVIVLAAGAADAFAQMGVYIGGFAGYSAQKPSFEDVQFTTDTTFFYGFRGGIRFLMLALEVSYFRAMHNIGVNDFLTLDWDGRINDFSYIGLNLRYIFSLAIFHPYLTGGYGYYTADIENIDQDKEGGVNIGAGLEISLGKRISIVAEGKYHHVAVDIQRLHVGLGNFMISGGLNIHF